MRAVLGRSRPAADVQLPEAAEPPGDRAHAGSDEADHAEGAPVALRLQDGHPAADGAAGLDPRALDEAAELDPAADTVRLVLHRGADRLTVDVGRRPLRLGVVGRQDRVPALDRVQRLQDRVARFREAVAPQARYLPAMVRGRRVPRRVPPGAPLFETELRDKLDVPNLRLDIASLAAADVHGRARAWRSLVGTEAKMRDEDAQRLVGLDG